MSKTDKYYKKLCNIIAATKSSVTGSKIRRVFENYCEEKDIQVDYPFDGLEEIKALNKRDMLYKNLLCFKEDQKDEILTMLAKDNEEWLDLIQT